MSQSRGMAVSLLVAFALGCDEVGAPLVDELPPPPAPPPTVDCTLPPVCMPPQMPKADAPPRTALPVDLDVCGAATTRSCALRNVADGVEVGIESVDEGAGSDAGAPYLPPLMDCAPILEAASAECGALDIVAEGGEHVLTGLALRSVNLSIRATRPTRLTLDDASLEAVFVAIEGPITLLLLRGRSLDALRVVSNASSQGEPTLELVDVDGHALQVGTVETPFGGDLSFDRVALQDTGLVAERLELESVAFETGRIEARSLTGVDVQIARSTLALGDAVLAAFTLTETIVERCEALTLVSGKALRSELAACSGPPTRVYDAKVIASRADGSIESDASLWEGVAFGASAETRLVAFGGVLRSVNFCDATEGPMLGDGVAVSCSMCEGWTRPSQLPCQLPARDALVPHANFCALLDASTFPVCPAPVPERERPLMLPF